MYMKLEVSLFSIVNIQGQGRNYHWGNCLTKNSVNCF